MSLKRPLMRDKHLSRAKDSKCCTVAAWGLGERDGGRGGGGGAASPLCDTSQR